MSGAIAVVGMACRYADARDPRELWENVLAQRRAFRRIPAERLALEDYTAPRAAAAEAVTASEAALIEGYEFDRVGFRVPGAVFRSVDLTHWLALDVAASALADAGFPGGAGAPLDTTGVLVGNTLTGEFSRAASLRLRWPYVRRVVAARLRDEGFDGRRRDAFLRGLERLYKEPFPAPDEETLAGGLSNTIAGRICSHFRLGGGGYALDGACCSSLLAVARACSALEAGELDLTLAGGVDLSLDPFELVGFSRAGALARGPMRVYDEESSGFLPGEGCGFVALMRERDARRASARVHALIRGWGVSSDGGGSITRPEERGQRLALERAYARAGYGPETVALFEGHGTGTPVGDEVELRALAAARRAGRARDAAAVGSVKANLGHTKAAAGAAGLIKAVMAVARQVLPPTTGLRRPRPELLGDERVLRALSQGEPWPAGRPPRAGVSSFGFGGINVHVTLEGPGPASRGGLPAPERRLLASAQDAELFLLVAADAAVLSRELGRLGDVAAGLSYAELGDLAAVLARGLGDGTVRAAVVATSPAELAERLRRLAVLVTTASGPVIEPDEGVFFGAGGPAARIVFLFPGQASAAREHGGAAARRFAVVRETLAAADPGGLPPATTQLAIVAAELAGLRWLDSVGIEGRAAVGHSLGELAALHWGGVLDAPGLLELARVRGRLMWACRGPAGAMAGLGAGEEEARELLLEAGGRVVVAGFNAPGQTVVSGEAAAVAALVARARARGLRAVELSTTGAFHSPLMAPAVAPLATHLARAALRPARRRVISTVTGAPLDAQADLPGILVRQLTEPVRFTQALARAAGEADVFLEVGPGEILTGLVRESTPVPALSLDVGGPSLRGLLAAAGAAHALGARLHTGALFDERFTRPFDLERRPRFFVSPCERAPRDDDTAAPRAHADAPADVAPAVAAAHTNGVGRGPARRAVDVVRALVAERAELPPEAVRDDSRLLRDLHLNSLAVGELVAEAARRCGLAPPSAPLEFAGASVADVGRALDELRATGPGAPPEAVAAPAGIDRWMRAFRVTRRERPLPARPAAPPAHGPPARWRVLGTAGGELRAALADGVAGWPGGGLVLCLSPVPDADELRLLLEASRSVLAAPAAAEPRFVVVQEQATAGAFARTLHLEAPAATTCVVEAPFEARAAAWVREEALRAAGHVEACYDADGRRFEPGLEVWPLPDGPAGATPLRRGDLLVATGGAKGVVALCAQALAGAIGAHVALLGRSDPSDDAALAGALSRLRAEGLSVSYHRADVTDRAALGAALAAVQAEHGPAAALLHGAGVNEPRRLRDLDEAALRRTLAPKLGGFHNLLVALDPRRLRLLVTFGSVIGRIGLRGQADYALANALLRKLTEDFAARHPACRCLALESSVWADLGMGERLGRVEALRREGVAPLPPDEAAALVGRLCAQPVGAGAVVVAGRLGAPAPPALVGPELPLWRFLERPRVHYPGVELVADCELSSASDPYLLEHVFEGRALLPAVMGLEAMAQAAAALTGEARLPVFEDVRFERPLAVPERARVTLRVAALARAPGRVEVALRSSQTGFHVDHFRCLCRFDLARETAPARPPAPGRLDLHPGREIYGGLLFQSGRFRRVTGYRRLAAGGSCAEIGAGAARPWFGPYLPGELLLGDAAARDAALHSLQACVPHARLLPVGVERLTPGAPGAGQPLLACARERFREGDTYAYDLDLCDAAGRPVERWQGLRLRRVADARHAAWSAALLLPHLEWRLRELLAGARLGVALARNGVARGARSSDRLLQALLGSPAPPRRDRDGRPLAQGRDSVSAAHAQDLTLAVAGPGRVACDLEPVRRRAPRAWRDLVGRDGWELAGLIAEQAGEDRHAAATRVWTALECARKAAAAPAPLLLVGCEPDGWVALSAPGLTVATYAARLRRRAQPLVFAAASGGAAGKETCAPSTIGSAWPSKTPTS